MLRHKLLLVLILSATALALTTPTPSARHATPDGSLSAAFLQSLDADLREPVGACLRLTTVGEGNYVKLEAPLRRRLLIRAVMKCVDQTPFVLGRLRAEPVETRLWILMEMPVIPHWRQQPGVDAALDALVDEDSSPEVVRQALDTHRQLDVQRLRDRLDARLQRAPHAEMLSMLREEQERFYSLEHGTMLPTFLRRLDAPFAVPAPARALRIVAFGDFGTGEPGQVQTAAVIRKRHAARPFDLGLTLGDNFYSQGLSSPHDPRWDSQWEALYGQLHIPFYATLGNHDWYHPDSPAAQILRSRDSRSWRLPASYYTFTAGPAQFFALDTQGWSEHQAEWLRAALEASHARWKIVYGHHPPFVASSGANPAYQDETGRWAAQIVPILTGRADMMLAGHHHSLQHAASRDGVEYFIAGGGGAVTYPTNEAIGNAHFAESAHGFATLDIAPDALTVRLISTERGERYAYTLRKK